MGAEIFTLFGRIVTNASQVVGELGKVDSAAQKTGAAMSLGFARANAAIQQNAGAIRAVGVAMTAAGVAIAAGLGMAVKSAISFNEGMANVATLIPGNTERVLALKDAIKLLAMDVGKPLGDLTEGLYQVISAFGDAADTEQKMNVVARAGVAGRAQTVEALNLLSAVTKGYGDTSAAALQHVSDLAFVTVKLGQTTFPELAGSLGKVVSIAQAMGISLEELFAVMATGTGVTGKADEVATQFRGVLNALMNPQKQMIELLEKHEYASGQAMIADRGLIGSLQLIAEEAKAGGHQMIDYISQVEALPIALALTGAQADVFKEKLAAMGGAAGATDEAFREQAEGINKLGFTMGQLQARIEVLRTEIGDNLAPVLLPLVERIGEIAKGIGEWASKYPGLARGLTVAAAGLAAFNLLLGPLLIALPSVMLGIVAIVSAGGVPALSAGFLSLAAAGGPVALFTLALGTLIGTLWKLIDAWNEWKRVKGEPGVELAERTELIKAEEKLAEAEARAAKFRLAGREVPALTQADISGWKQRIAYLRQELAKLQAEAATAPAPSGAGDKGGPTTKTVEELGKELALAREILAGKLAEAKTDEQRIALQKELIALLTRYGHEAALEELTRLQLLHEAQNLQRDMGKEAFAIAESENAHNIKKAMSFAALVEALETQRDLYEQMAISGKLVDADRQAALDKMLDTEKTLQTARAEYAASNLAVEKAMVATYAQERAYKEHEIRVLENQLATEQFADNEKRDRFAAIKGLQRELAAFDEQHLQNVHAINLADAQTFEQQRNLLSIELARQRMIEAAPVTAVLDEAAHEAAHARVLAIRAAIVALNLQEINQQLVIHALEAGNRQQINASFEERISLQQTIIDGWQEMELGEEAAGAATEQRLNLEREQRQALLAYDLALIDQRIAAERHGYEEKNELLQAAVEAEITAGGKVLDQIELRKQIEQNAYAAIDEARSKLQESGRWESMTLEQQAAFLADQLATWEKIAGVAMPDVQRNLTEMRLELQKLDFSLRGFLLSMSGQLKSDFESFFKGLMDGTKTFRDLWASVLSDIQTWIARIIAEFVWAQTVGRLLGSDDSPQKASNTNLLASTAMGVAAQLNKEAGKTMGLAAIAMQNAANAMAAAGTPGGDQAGGIWGMLSSVLGGGGDGGGGIDVGAYADAFSLLDAIPTFAAGGIVTRPTFALLAERGEAEVVTPLSQIGQVAAAAGAGGGVTEVHHHYSINAVDAASFVELAHRNRSGLASAIQVAVGENNPAGRRRR